MRHPAAAAPLHLLAERTATILTHVKAPIALIKSELDALKNALAEAPEPEVSWDLFSVRRASTRIWWVLRHEHCSPPRMAAAIFLGVLIGCSPFYGFHVILCLVLAFVFRLNKLVVWLGSNVSLPIFAPFLTFLSIQCGHLIVHQTLADISLAGIRATGALELFWYWTLGFVPVGSVLGAAFGLIVLLKLRPEDDATR